MSDEIIYCPVCNCDDVVKQNGKYECDCCGHEWYKHEKCITLSIPIVLLERIKTEIEKFEIDVPKTRPTILVLSTDFYVYLAPLSHFSETVISIFGLQIIWTGRADCVKVY